MNARSWPPEFLVAFSLAGEQRDLVRAIAEAVERRLGYLTVDCVQEALFQVACYAPLRHPEGSRRDIAEALVRANYGLRVASSRWILTTVNFCFQAFQSLDGDAVGWQ